jgi:small subunit ribosomal protein S2
VIAVTDTNCDPDDADFLIPVNDDAIRSVRLIAAGIADASLEGTMRMEISQAERSLDAGRGESRRRRGSESVELTPAFDEQIEAIADEVSL